MIKNLKKILVLLLTIVMATVIFTGCIEIVNPPNVLSIEKTSTDGLVDTYTITYTDGSTSTFTITNGKDGNDAPEISIDELFNRYKQDFPDATYEEFLKKYLSVEVDISALTINRALSSSVKLYSEFIVTSNNKNVKSVGAGSGVIYSINEEYTYIITNYHVVYEYNPNTTSNIAKKIVCYLYGSESSPTKLGTGTDGYAVYDYGKNAVECEYVGGSILNDIAVIKAKTNDLKAVNDNITAIEFAKDYHVGETAIAIGNPEDNGISVTKGIVSVDCEKIQLQLDSQVRFYDLLRMDTPLYAGNSGGGLFNVEGKLIGITNAGDTVDQNVNFAVPLNTVKNTVENIVNYINGSVNKITLGVTVQITDSKYVYDSVSGYGHIVEELKIVSVADNSIAKGLSLQADDILVGMIINGNTVNFDRDFDVSNIILTLRSGNQIAIKYKRNGTEYTTSTYTIKPQDIKASE